MEMMIVCGIVGLFIGTIFGFFVAALCQAAARGSEGESRHFGKVQVGTTRSREDSGWRVQDGE